MKEEEFKKESLSAESSEARDSAFDKKEIPGMFQGPVLPVLVKLSVPILFGMLFQILYNVVDTLWVSRIDLNDPSYVGGTGLIFPVVFFVIALGNGLSVGISSLVARAIGEKNREVLNRTAESGLVIALVLSAVSVLVMVFFGETFVRAMGAEGDYFVHGRDYLYYLVPTAVLMFLGNVFFGILQGEGLMKNVMVAMIIGTVANIALDPVFIFLLDMDVRGAAIATGLGQLLSVLYVLRIFVRGKTLVPVRWSLKNVEADLIRKIIVIGFPQALGMIIMSVAMILLNKLVIRVDVLALTAFSLCGRMEQLVLMPAFALGAAIITIVGQNSGRGNFDRVGLVVKSGYVTGMVSVFVLATLMILLARLIFSQFSGIPAVVDYAVHQTYVLEYTYLFALVGILNRSFFQAIGYPLPALFLTLLRVLIISIPAAYIYVDLFHTGIWGVWAGLGTGSLVSSVISYTWVNRMVRDLKSGKRQIRHV